MRSRCVQGRPVRYDWYGDEVPADATVCAESRVASWFARKTANELLNTGNLKSAHFDDFRIQLEGFVRNKLSRAAQGKLLPGSEVQTLQAALPEGLDMFEFRLHFPCRLLDADGRKLLIRHYDEEPRELPENVYGVHMHVKDVSSGRDAEIHSLQNDHIAYAIAKCHDGLRHNWHSESMRKDEERR